jgi:arginyl-tRNA synthetase
MFFRHEVFKESVASAAHEALKRLAAEKGATLKANADSAALARLLGTPPQFEMGQAAMPCFPFAKELKMPPATVASELAESINRALQSEQHSGTSLSERLIERVEPAGGFLNFFAHIPNLASHILPQILDGSLFHSPLCAKEQQEKIVIEYSQPNTHKALHIGHLRCLVLGDAVSRILEGAGHTVIKVTYPGDMGAHIAKTLWYLKNHYTGTIPTTHRGDWLGDLYADAHSFVEERSRDAAAAEIVKCEIGQILAELQQQNGPYYDLWKETREWSLDEMRSVYNWMNVTFDEWFTESECDEPSRQLVQEKFQEGLFIQDQGAIGIDLTPYKLGFALLLKSDGNGLYLTKDLELIRRKFKDTSVTRSIVVVDSRQKLHFQQVFKIAELMGYPQAAHSVHLAYETVNTADGKKAFSSRSKNGVKLGDLKNQMEEKVKTTYLERYRNHWSAEEINLTAEKVTRGALKYGMLKVDNNTPVNFDLNEWLRLDGDTGPYLQYVHARCLNVLAKQTTELDNLNATDAAFNTTANQGAHPLYAEPTERELLIHLIRYFEAVRNASEQLRPAILSTYLYDLAKNFNRFYEACSIKESTGPVRAARLDLVRSTARVMEAGLTLLGIDAPERM